MYLSSHSGRFSLPASLDAGCLASHVFTLCAGDDVGFGAAFTGAAFPASFAAGGAATFPTSLDPGCRSSHVKAAAPASWQVLPSTHARAWPVAERAQ